MLTFLLVIEDEKTRNKLEELYIRYHKEMYYIAMSILSNTHDAQDCVQTSILKLADYIETIEDIHCNKTKHFIVTIIKNTSIDNYRIKKAHPVLDFEAFEDLADDQEMKLEQLIIRLADSKWMAEKLAIINPDYASILTLRYYHELKDIEIAEALNISRELVHTRLHRAKKCLKKVIMDESTLLRKKDLCYEIH